MSIKDIMNAYNEYAEYSGKNTISNINLDAMLVSNKDKSINYNRYISLKRNGYFEREV